ncbi:MAG: hypothetical protein UW68_C0006G0028 [Candidatus Collierbacteria bacterium GW2011_GWB1_44_6]|uniref:Uncharacterized protein n=2 Tax=Candidatus Collieribacteriota TaxID=1752725 RepID=A0A0G1JQ03_9BACT|nr:MAG: hypothetical protein UV68_C0023G0008 [Candidatus Collierbacteria bacterium GW2011_GWC2_43_12]KKT73586.1 MAG: hypothetical protein UW68_C0006G0028 [Candidatus Collierbacteria bacterium GW2011_GWB1_44_6]KKT83263.1 MAG: hypothetical protein UW80_C0018G0014 [Microgenomates group bacterium GW2011_GWC1_44_9]
MSIKLLSEPDKSLLPVVCVCQSCNSRFEVSDFSDFQHKTLYSGMDNEAHDEVVIVCSICGDYAFPPAAKTRVLIAAYELWKKSTPVNKRWSKNFTCNHCRKISRVTVSDIHVFNTAVLYAGETWDPEVRIVCPVCHTQTAAGKHVPRGIQNELISEAESKSR